MAEKPASGFMQAAARRLSGRFAASVSPTQRTSSPERSEGESQPTPRKSPRSRGGTTPQKSQKKESRSPGKKSPSKKNKPTPQSRKSKAAKGAASPTKEKTPEKESDPPPDSPETFDPMQCEHFTQPAPNKSPDQGLTQVYHDIHDGLSSFDFENFGDEGGHGDVEGNDGGHEDGDGGREDGDGGRKDGEVKHVSTKQTGIKAAVQKRQQSSRSRRSSQKVRDAEEAKNLAAEAHDSDDDELDPTETGGVVGDGGPSGPEGSDSGDAEDSSSDDDVGDDEDDDAGDDGTQSEDDSAKSPLAEYYSPYVDDEAQVVKKPSKKKAKKNNDGAKKRKADDASTLDSDFAIIRRQLGNMRKSIAKLIKEKPAKQLGIPFAAVISTKPEIARLPIESITAFTNELTAQGSKKKMEAFIFPPSGNQKKRAKKEQAAKKVPAPKQVARKRKSENTSPESEPEEEDQDMPGPKKLRDTLDLRKLVLGSDYKDIGNNEEALLMRYRPREEDKDDANWNEVRTMREAGDLKRRTVDSKRLEQYGLGPDIASYLPSSYVLAPQVIVYLGRPSPQSEIVRYDKTHDVVCGINKEWVDVHGGTDFIPSKVSKNDVVFLNGYDVRLINKWVYFVGAYKVVGGKCCWGDKIGYVKCLPENLHLILNRCAMVTATTSTGKSGSDQAAIYKTVGGKANISFLDVGDIQDKRWLNRAGKATGLRSNKHA